MNVRDAVEVVSGYTHRDPPSDREMAEFHRLARETDDPRVRAVIRSTLDDLETLREIRAELNASDDCVAAQD